MNQRWNVLRELGQEIQRRENLEIPLRRGCDAVSVLVGKGPARLLLRLVDHLTRLADLHQPGQTKRAPGHVLHQEGQVQRCLQEKATNIS